MKNENVRSCFAEFFWNFDTLSDECVNFRIRATYFSFLIILRFHYIWQKSFEVEDNGGSEEEDDPFEALFNLLEEDLKNDNSIDDEEISEEDLDALAEELAQALGGGDDVDGIDLFGSATGDVVDDEDDDDDSEEDERPTKLKNWQLRRLAYALKAGRRKTSVSLSSMLRIDVEYVV